MKIQVTDQSRSFTIPFPTGLVFNKAGAKIGSHFIRKYAPDSVAAIPPEALEELFAELNRIKKKHGSWELVEVKSADGEHVKITL